MRLKLLVKKRGKGRERESTLYMHLISDFYYNVTILFCHNSRQIVHDLDRVTGEKQSLLSSTEQLINERDNALSQCNRLMAESSSASSEQGYLAQQNNDLMTERDQLKQELRETKSLLEKVRMYTHVHVYPPPSLSLSPSL